LADWATALGNVIGKILRLIGMHNRALWLSTVEPALAAVLKGLSGQMSQAGAPRDLTGYVTAEQRTLSAGYQRMQRLFSSPAAEDILREAEDFERTANAVYLGINELLMVAEALSLGQLDMTLTPVLSTPLLRAYFGTAARIAQTRDEASILIGVRQQYLARTTPMIPSTRDLISMVVHEVISPEDFKALMPLHGFSSTWADRYWEDHWRLLPLGEVKDARHRGIIDGKELDTYLVLHDYKPEPRPGIHISDRDIAAQLAWDLPGRIDTRWMYRWGEIAVDDIEGLLVQSGLHPDWAPKVASAYAKQQLAVEINRLRDNAKKDFVEGLMDEAALRAALTELGYPPDWVEFHVADAASDRERENKEEWLSFLDELFLAGEIDPETYQAELAKHIVDPKALELRYARKYYKRFKKLPGE